MSSTPLFVGSVKSYQGQLSAANANRDGTGTVVTICTAGATGLRIDDIELKAQATTTAGMVRLFIHDGTNYRLWKEQTVSAITPSATVAAWSASLTNLGLCLESGWSLRASTEKAEVINVIATRAGSY